jgi:hypothetical protein
LLDFKRLKVVGKQDFVLKIVLLQLVDTVTLEHITRNIYRYLAKATSDALYHQYEIASNQPSPLQGFLKACAISLVASPWMLLQNLTPTAQNTQLKL